MQDKVSEHKIKQLEEIQSRLFDVGAHVARPRSLLTDKEKLAETTFSPIHTKNLEHWIDEIDATLEPLKEFVLPSGGLAATAIHIARAVCRRCERLLAEVLEQGKIESTVFEYVNRLSDYLFVLARFIVKETNNKEKYWIKSEIN
jgi:ATP:cob(I)alamin adenosyltransferase